MKDKYCHTHRLLHPAEEVCPKCQAEEPQPATLVVTESITVDPHPLDVQVGGDHYKKMKIQPVVFIMANNLGFCEGNVIKYVCRQKGARLQDLRKARHYLDILIADEEAARYPEQES